MLDVAVLVLIVGLGFAGLLCLFKRAAQQDARDEQLREAERGPAPANPVEPPGAEAQRPR